MKLSQAVAGGSRNVAPTRDFLSSLVNSAEPDGPSRTSWKWSLHHRIWSEDGPKGNAARSVLTVLLWNADEAGRTWLGIPALMRKTGIGNERTVRKALDVLAKEGWIQITSQTWFSLTKQQMALGRQVPRRGDGGQASNLYTVLASPRPTQTGEAPTRPGLTRTAGISAEDTPRQICPRPQEQICPGEPPANLPPDPYQGGSVSRTVSEGGSTPLPTDTHIFLKAQETKGDWSWLDAWNLVVQAHAEKTRAVYGVPPMPPDLKRDDRRALGECLDGTAVELAAKLRARGMERELVQVRQDLATRIMALYFKRDNEHLRKVKHALRDLPREFHARIIEAMQAILRESHDAVNVPRRTQQLELPARENKAEKPAEMKKTEAAEKPLSVTAQEARRIIEALNAPSSGPELAKRSNPEPVSSNKSIVEASQETTEDVTSAPQLVQRSPGRAGAPRWGALPPTPTKIRRVSRLQLTEPEDVTDSFELELRA
jgi:hypothetical protein